MHVAGFQLLPVTVNSAEDRELGFKLACRNDAFHTPLPARCCVGWRMLLACNNCYGCIPPGMARLTGGSDTFLQHCASIHGLTFSVFFFRPSFPVSIIVLTVYRFLYIRISAVCVVAGLMVVDAGFCEPLRLACMYYQGLFHGRF